MACSSCSNNNGVPRGCKSNGNCASGCGKLDVHDWLSNIDTPHGQSEFDVVEIRFKNDRKSFFKNQNNLTITSGDIVTVQATSGYDVGVVTLTGELVKMQMKKKKVRYDNYDTKVIFRKSSEEEITKWHESRKSEKETMRRGRIIAEELNLRMKICDVEYQADGKKITVFYTADERVDFRELIKRYAEEFKVRVEMRQIGARQEAGKLGGIGSCGRELCCSTWLTDFRSVNTSAARYQQLSLNPQKLAGQCGKLKCCLNFELDLYVDEMRKYPHPNVELLTEEGVGRHQKNDIFKGLVWYIVSTDVGAKFYPLELKQAESIIRMNKEGKKPKTLADYTFKEEVEPEVNYENVVGQDDLNRFDDKFKSKKKGRKKGGNRKGNQGNTPRQPQNNNNANKGDNSADKKVNNNRGEQNKNQPSNNNKKPSNNNRGANNRGGQGKAKPRNNRNKGNSNTNSEKA